MQTTNFLLLALAAVINAHTVFKQLEVLKGGKQWNMMKKAEGVRMPAQLNYPIKFLEEGSWKFLPCNGGRNALTKTDVVVKVNTGDEIHAIWRITPNTETSAPDDIIDKSHKGPVIAYLKKVANAVTDDGVGDGWFKIQQDGLTNGVFGVERLRQNKGKQQIIIPDCIEPGQYLLRAELIALHEASQAGGPQFYMSCAQLQISARPGSTATTKKPTTIDLNKSYTKNVPGLVMNIYDPEPNKNTKYDVPGGEMFKC